MNSLFAFVIVSSLIDACVFVGGCDEFLPIVIVVVVVVVVVAGPVLFGGTVGFVPVAYRPVA